MVVFFQAEDGIRDLVRSRGLGDVYKRQARDKYLMRCLLRDGGAAVPWFRRFTTADDPAAVAAQVPYPCVVKPLNLNGSRGVMRADSTEELIAAIERLTRLIAPGQALSPQPSPKGRGGGISPALTLVRRPAAVLLALRRLLAELLSDRPVAGALHDFGHRLGHPTTSG